MSPLYIASLIALWVSTLSFMWLVSYLWMHKAPVVR